MRCFSSLPAILALLLFAAACSDNGTPRADARPAISPEECKGRGAQIMGDPGDGRIHRSDYRCPSGKRPVASIRYAQGDLIPVEGSVCCPK